MRPQPLICVRDVEASSRWYQRLLGCESVHGGPEYERLVSRGSLVLQLHRWDVEHHHGPIGPGKPSSLNQIRSKYRRRSQSVTALANASTSRRAVCT